MSNSLISGCVADLMEKSLHVKVISNQISPLGFLAVQCTKPFPAELWTCKDWPSRVANASDFAPQSTEYSPVINNLPGV